MIGEMEKMNDANLHTETSESVGKNMCSDMKGGEK